MPEDEIKQPTPQDDKADILQEIEELKKNSVKKEDFDKIKQERDEAYRKLMRGETLDNENDNEDKVDIDAIRKELFTTDCHLTNLDYTKKALALRKELMRCGNPDPFLGRLAEGLPSDDDVEEAQHIADFLQELVDESEDSPEAFRALMQSRLVDPKMPTRR